MILKIFTRKLVLTLITLITCFAVGCSEDCDEEHTFCLAKINTSLDQFSYEETCRYPSMNSGDARRFCECEDDYTECKAE